MTTPAEEISGMKEASQAIQSYTYPLLQFDGNRRPEMVASCVFLQVDNAVHLVTAAHALRGRTVGLMTRGPSNLFDIRAQGGMARGLNGEEFDIAVLKMDRETVEKQAIRSVSPGDHLEFHKSPDIHLGLNYGPGTDDAGRVLTSPPSPRGSSGGGTWLVPDFGKPDQVFLEGILIECHRKKFVFSTRIEHVVNFIRAQDSLGTRT